MTDEIAHLADWMEKNAQRHRYAEVTATLRIQDGKLTFIERSVTEKVKPSTGETGGHYAKHHG